MRKLGPPYARPELRGRYLIREPVKAQAMAAIDLMLSALPRSKPPMPKRPRKILVCNWAHLGDVVLTIPAIIALGEAFPDAQIDFLTRSGSRDVAANVPGIGRVHTIDHWNLNRSEASWMAKRSLYLRQRRAVVADISQAGYDLAIDFYQHFPTAAFELWSAGIPVRIGYASGGLSPLLTTAVDWTLDDRHVIERHSDLLKPVLGAAAPGLTASYPLTPSGKQTQLAASDLPVRYVLIHTGSGGVEKEWAESNWLQVARLLAKQGESIVLAGAGRREGERNARLAAAIPNTIDLTNALDWTGLVSLVAGARAMIGLDSVSVHLGAAFRIPTVCIRSGAVSSKVWGPLNSRAIQLTAPTACAPCHRIGCDAMTCLTGVLPGDVLRAFGQLDLRTQPGPAPAEVRAAIQTS